MSWLCCLHGHVTLCRGHVIVVIVVPWCGPGVVSWVVESYSLLVKWGGTKGEVTHLCVIMKKNNDERQHHCRSLFGCHITPSDMAPWAHLCCGRMVMVHCGHMLCLWWWAWLTWLSLVAVLYPPQVIPYGIHGMEGGIHGISHGFHMFGGWIPCV
jgi:hypothetical protein